MDIQILNNKSANNVVDKKIIEIIKVEGVVFKEDVSSVQNPVLWISGITDIGVVSRWNYIRIYKFDRYYYVDNIKMLNGGIVQLSCSVDVLMSFKKDIKASTQVVARNQNKTNPYLDDKALLMHVDNSYEIKQFGDSFANPTNYVLQIAGGITNS